MTVESGVSLLLLRCLNKHGRDILSTLFKSLKPFLFFIVVVCCLKKKILVHIGTKLKLL